MNRLFSNPWIRKLVPAVAGFVGYGAWAYYANLSHGTKAAVTAAAVQGSYSFALTLSTAVVMEKLFQTLAACQQRVFWTSLLTCSGLFGTAYGINWLAGTPEILMTILPGFAIGSLFTLWYVRNLAHAV